MFRTVPLSMTRSFSLYTEQWYKPASKPVWHIPLLCVQWKTPDGGQRNCPKHVDFYSKNKFEKLVHLVVLVIRIYHDARSLERQIRNIFKCADSNFRSYQGGYSIAKCNLQRQHKNSSNCSSFRFQPITLSPFILSEFHSLTSVF